MCNRYATAIRFLNEVADDYPHAISLAAGQPTSQFWEQMDTATILDAVSTYQRHRPKGNDLLQYGPTAGIIGDLVAEHLRIDEGIHAAADRVLITAGCQEALHLSISSLCETSGDVLLALNPTYAGAVGAARACGVDVCSIPGSTPNLPEAIREACTALHAEGRRAKALYLIPTFDNPTGRTLGIEERMAVLDVCAELRIIILEDNPYGMFRYEGEPVPAMAALDSDGCVIYLSTFSKTLAPTLRVGAIALPERLLGDGAAHRNLQDKLLSRKSLISINTSQLSQAIVGGILLKQQYTLRRWIEPALNWYNINRDTMLEHLDAHLSSCSRYVNWNRPAGGFFLTVNLPFRFDTKTALACAAQHGVIAMPMSFFSSDDSQDKALRLSFSHANPQQIADGIRGLASYIERHMEEAA